MKEELTHKSITDDHCRKIWSVALGCGDRKMARTAKIALGEWHTEGERLATDHELIVIGARVRCAEVWNERGAEIFEP